VWGSKGRDGGKDERWSEMGGETGKVAEGGGERVEWGKAKMKSGCEKISRTAGRCEIEGVRVRTGGEGKDGGGGEVGV